MRYEQTLGGRVKLNQQIYRGKSIPGIEIDNVKSQSMHGLLEKQDGVECGWHGVSKVGN